MKKHSLPWLLLALTPASVLAHTSASHALSFAAGAAHPVSGLDHLLVLVVAGAWLALQSGATAAKLGLAMILALSLGMVSGGLATNLPLEPLVLTTLAAVGIGVAQRRFHAPAMIGAALVATGLIHGLVHGVEMPAGATVFAFGLVAGSSVILASSTMVFRLLRRHLKPGWVRFFGFALAALGLAAGF